MTLAFWGIAALLLAGALLFVLPPLLRAPAPAPTASPLAVYREQRAQFDSERAQGSLTAEQHALSLQELQDRVINEVGSAAEPAVARPNARLSLASVLAVALLVPGGSVALYAALGRPAVLAPPTQSANSAGKAPHVMSREQIEEMVERLAEKMQRSPEDAEGWHMLARSYVAIGRLPEAAQAYDRASKLAPRDAQVLADYADTLAMVNGRNLEGRPSQLVSQALQIDPAHPKSLALAGTAAFNRGDFAGAVVWWQKLQAVVPPDSDQARSIAANIAQAQSAADQAPRPGNTPAGAPRSAKTRGAAP